MQPAIVFFFFDLIISIKDYSVYLDLYRVGSLLNVCCKFLLIYSNVPPLDDSVGVYSSDLSMRPARLR